MSLPQTYRSPRSPVPQEVTTELERMGQRWRQLPLAHALSSQVRVRELVQALADGVAEVTGVPATAVPDCGPAALMDQLSVVVYDAYATAVTAARTSTLESTLTSTLGHDLADLRRALG